MHKMIYSKFSNDRAPAFNIITEIIDVNGKLVVRKCPYTPASREHIHRLHTNFNELSKRFVTSNFQANVCNLEDGKAYFEYIHEKTLEEHLDELLALGEVDQFMSFVTLFVDEVRKTYDSHEFKISDDFIQVFGEVDLPSSVMASHYVNIDLLFSNVLPKGKDWIVIDYEWTFDFLIPINFLIYRTFVYYAHNNPMRNILFGEDVLKSFGITAKEIQQYYKMDMHFMTKYVLGETTDLHELYNLMGKETISLHSLIHAYGKKSCTFQVYYDYGHGYSEKDSYTQVSLEELSEITLKIPIPPETKGIRIDPGSSFAAVKIIELVEEGALVQDLPYTSNASFEEDGFLIFNTTDPNIYVTHLLSDVKKVRFKMYYTMLTSEITVESIKHLTTLQDNVTGLQKECSESYNKIKQLEEQLYQHHLIFSSRSYRIFSRLKRVVTPIRSFFHLLHGKKKDNLKSFTPEDKINEVKNMYPHAAHRLRVLKQVDSFYYRKLLKLTGDLKFSILVPLYNTPESYLREMIESVVMQIYHNWELCLADGSNDPHFNVEGIVKEYRDKDNRIKYQKLDKNYGIAGNTNACLEMATGDYVALLDHDDFLHPEALFRVNECIVVTAADFVYTDEVTFDSELNHYKSFHLKPDYAPDNLRAVNYICHFVAFKKDLLGETSLFRNDYDGSQDHDMVLRLTHQAKNIKHIQGVLYFWRYHEDSVTANIEAKEYAIEAGRRAVCDYLTSTHILAKVKSIEGLPTLYEIEYPIDTTKSVRVIIPYTGEEEQLYRCLLSIKETNTYENMEVMLVCKSKDFPELQNLLEDKGYDFIRIHKVDNELTTTEMLNQGANASASASTSTSASVSDFILFLEDTVCITTESWIEKLLMYAAREDVGVVGARIWKENKTIGSAGIVIGTSERPLHHLHQGVESGSNGVNERLVYAQNFTAVSGTCMMIERKKWNSLDAFDLSYGDYFYDVDLCLKSRMKGYLNIFTPFVDVINQGTIEGQPSSPNYLKDKDIFISKWEKVVNSNDPYYNNGFEKDKIGINLDLIEEYYSWNESGLN